MSFITAAWKLTQITKDIKVGGENTKRRRRKIVN